MEPLNPAPPEAHGVEPPTAKPRTEPPAGEPGEGDLVLVLTTEASQELAEQLARILLERGLVACASLLPIVSLYRWEGELTRSAEVQLVLKTLPRCLEDLQAAVLALHSYDTPEWITLPGRTRGGYGRWCVEQLTSPPPLRADVEPPTRPGTPGDGAPAG